MGGGIRGDHDLSTFYWEALGIAMSFNFILSPTGKMTEGQIILTEIGNTNL